MNPTLTQLTRMRREHPRGWTRMAAMLMAGLSLVIGLGVTIYDGGLGKYMQVKLFFIAVGLIGFNVPGLLMFAAAAGLNKGWVGVVRLGSLAAAAQGLMALVVTIGWFGVMEFEPLTMIQGLLWTAADFYVAWLLWRALPWVAADAQANRGFEVGAVEAQTA